MVAGATDSGAHPSNAEQMASPSYRLAALDEDFLLGDSMRGVRFLLEYAKAEDALRAWGVRSTIVVFGSARISETGPGRRHRQGQARRAADAAMPALMLLLLLDRMLPLF